MLSSMFSPSLIGSGLLLAVVQVLVALPWLYAFDPKWFKQTFRTASGLAYFAGGVLALGVGLALFMKYNENSTKLLWWGRGYGIALHLQLLADVFLWAPHLLALVLPKSGAVALAAYREAWRQPMFWLILGGAMAGMWLAVVLPYFTFGDDFKMMKQIGFDIIMLAPALFGVLASSISVSEEIEGRTAITVMSKPINRRSFLVGKFLGVLMACGGMALLLAANLNGALMANRVFDAINEDRAVDPMPEQAKAVFIPTALKAVPAGPGTVIVTGATLWAAESFAHSFGVLLGFGQVMILIAVATALATRLHFVVTLVVVLFVYMFGHLAPVVVRVTEASGGQGTGNMLVRFLAKVFDVILPALEFFNMSPAIIRETKLDLWAFAVYSGTVFGYSVIYTAIAVFIGLLLFEDRDLA